MSYNVSCSLSKQTIAPGHLCMLLPLVQQKAFTPAAVSHRGEPVGHFFGDTSSDCYPSARWSPSHSMIEATYDDGGQFYLSQDHRNLVAAMRYMQELYKERLSTQIGEGADRHFDFHSYINTELPDLGEVFQESRALHRLDVLESNLIEPVNAAWEYLSQALVAGTVFSFRQGTPAPVRLAAFHQAAVRGVIELSETRCDWDDNTLGRRESFDRALARAIEECSEKLSSLSQTVQSNVKVLLNRLSSPATAARTLDLEGPKSDYAFITMDFQSSMCDELMKLGDGSNVSSRISLNSRSTIRALFFGEITLEQCYAELLPDLDALSLAGGMMAMNMKFEPTNYAGQDFDNEAGQRYSTFMNNMSREMTALYGEADVDNERHRPNPK